MCFLANGFTQLSQSVFMVERGKYKAVRQKEMSYSATAVCHINTTLMPHSAFVHISSNNSEVDEGYA